MAYPVWSVLLLHLAAIAGNYRVPLFLIVFGLCAIGAFAEVIKAYKGVLKNTFCAIVTGSTVHVPAILLISYYIQIGMSYMTCMTGMLKSSCQGTNKLAPNMSLLP